MALITLTIDGEISIPRGFTFEELRRARGQIVDGGGLFGRRDVKALPLSALVGPLGIKPCARLAVVRGSDSFVANIPVAIIHQCILVYAVGELPLPAELGGPVRLFAPGQGRCANVKAVTSISLTVVTSSLDGLQSTTEGSGRASASRASLRSSTLPR
jgi:DMSO/TMAO reductase YedYZ molybdopterin-dependent catalytic subunit